MPNIKVCVRFRPLTSRERRNHGDSICIQCLDAESFVFKDEKKEDITFCFDRVFYQDVEQEIIYEFLAKPIVKDTINAINGTIITYGQTGSGKTFSMEGPDILVCDDDKKGLLPRVVDGLFQYLKSSTVMTVYTLKLSMVEIYMEKVRDLFDLSKDYLQLKECKSEGICLAGATEIPILDPAAALTCLSQGISNRAVGETHMNMGSSRSHCICTFSVQQKSTTDGRMKTGKLMLVDLAGSEKVEKTGAEGRVLEEAKMINKSLSALGNVINSLTAGKVNHIPYRNSKLTRILQDALGGNSRTALLCCCSSSSSNALESLSTLRFGMRTKLIKPPLRTNPDEDKDNIKRFDEKIYDGKLVDFEPLRTMPDEHKDNTKSSDEMNYDYKLVVLEPLNRISSLHQPAELRDLMAKLSRENDALEAELAAIETLTFRAVFPLTCLVLLIWILC